MKNILKHIISILISNIILIQAFMPIVSYAEDSKIGADGLIMLNIKGTDRTVTKTTTIDEIKNWYAGEHIFETPSLYGGKAYSFYVGSNFDDYLYIETIADGTIFSYGSVDPSYKTNTYSFGDEYPYTERNVLYGCLLSDDGKIIGGVYYNKKAYLNGNTNKIKQAYKDAFEEEYCKENKIEKSEIGTEKDTGRQPEIIRNLSKHAILMYNGLIHYYNRDESFMQTDRDENGDTSFTTFDEFFDINNQFIEFKTTAFNYIDDMNYNSDYYYVLGAKSDCEIYNSYYIFNPLQMAGMARIQKNTNLSNRNIPVWTYNYNEKKLQGISFWKDCFKRIEKVELTQEQQERYKKLREYYAKGEEKLNKEEGMYKTLPYYDEPEKMVAGELLQSKKEGIRDYFNAIRAGCGLKPVQIGEQGFDIAQHMTTLLQYRFEKFGTGLSHHPDKPEGVSQEYFDIAVRTGTSWGDSLSFMARTANSEGMKQHINNMLFDDNKDYQYGHRHHLLTSFYSDFGYGITGFFASLQLKGANGDYAPCVAWPACNGVTMMESLGQRNFAWTIKFYELYYEILDSCKTEIKNLNTGKVYTFDKEEGDVDSRRLYQNLTFDDITYSFANKILLKEPEIKPMAGEVYEVTVKGIKNVKTGNIEDYTYRTAFVYGDSSKDIETPKSIDIEVDENLEKTSANTYTGKVGNEYKLNAIIDDLNAVDKKITWSSSNSEYVSVNQYGKIKINKEGKDAIITVSLDADKNIQKKIKITPEDFKIIIDNDKIKNNTYTFTSLNEILQLPVYLSNGEDTTFTYSSSNEKAIKINENGTATSVAGGFANITVTDTKSGKSVICDCYVQVPVILSDGSKAYVGDMNRDGIFNALDTANILDSYKNNPSTDQILVGDINGDGNLTSLDASKAIDLFKAGIFLPGKYYPITKVSLNKTELTLQPNKNETLKATIEPENTTDSPKLTWKSGDESIAKVDETGKVTAIAKGSTEITATSANGKEDKCNITVIENIDKPQKLKGDVNGNGIVELTDYSMILKHVKGIKLLEGEQKERADVNENGTIELTDYSMVLKHVKGIKLLF
ncbi:MAG: Ig-like domain-containing protein [Clostridia bacterium]|nr:Ig-like domain-containing protein [Clostridia bacterium]